MIRVALQVRLKSLSVFTAGLAEVISSKIDTRIFRLLYETQNLRARCASKSLILLAWLIMHSCTTWFAFKKGDVGDRINPSRSDQSIDSKSDDTVVSSKS